MSEVRGNVITVRMDDEMYEAVKEATNPDGPYKFRSYSEFVRMLIERWIHDKQDSMSRREMYETIRRTDRNVAILVKMGGLDAREDTGATGAVDDRGRDPGTATAQPASL